MFFVNAGTSGPVFFIYIVASAFYMFILKDYGRYIFISAVIINCIILVLTELNYPNLIIYYDSKIQNILDKGSTFIMAFGALFYIIYYAKFHYEREKQNALKIEKLKSTFLTNMSHEIRTPMNAILGYSQLLDEPDTSDEEKKEYILNINKNGKLLINLMDNILDYTGIVSGELEINKNEFDITETFRDIYNTHINEIENTHTKNIKLNLITPNNKPKIINSDKVRMQQIIENLVDNAIKFTEEGSIDFGYDIDNFNNLTIFVTDTGVGIMECEQQYIFDGFRKANFVNDQYRQGIGLGLAITGKLIEALNGEISIQSKQNEGTNIKVYFSKKSLN